MLVIQHIPHANLRISLNLRTTQPGTRKMVKIFDAAGRLRQHRRLEFQPQTAGWWEGEYAVSSTNSKISFAMDMYFFVRHESFAYVLTVTKYHFCSKDHSFLSDSL